MWAFRPARLFRFNYNIGMMDKGTLDGLAEVVTTGLIMMIPIIAILVKHQQKMTALLRQAPEQSVDHAEVYRLRQDVDALRSDVSNLSTMLNNVVTQQTMMLQNAQRQDVPLEQRLKAN
jgi:hypothetical protein